jgi:glycosyltransferase involved in cell wall biosynthesis
MSPGFLNKFYNVFSYLVTHNNLSTSFLQKNFNIDANRVLQFPFPLIDLKKIKQVNFHHKDKSREFLFIGHFRKEKGYDLLIDAWKQLKLHECSSPKLMFAGKLGEEKNSIEKKIKGISSIQIINRFLSDDEFIECVAKADFVVLPYIAGTNSGVLSAVMSLGKIVLCSDILSFTSNKLVLERNLFKSQSKDDLAGKLLEYASYSDDEIVYLQQDVSKRYNAYRAEFEKACVKAFQRLLN